MLAATNKKDFGPSDQYHNSLKQFKTITLKLINKREFINSTLKNNTYKDLVALTKI